jgi:hypothetical protein
MRAAGPLCQAILQRRLLAFDYQGRPRVVASYCHGVTRAGDEVLRAVQVAGSSRSGRFGTGKLWKISEMRSVRLLDDAFVPDDPDYQPDDTAMSKIHCRI